jgi:hypothetical protein
MPMTRQNFQNVRDTIIMPNDPLGMDLYLVDYQGVPIDLREENGTTDLKFTVVSRVGGWWQSTILYGETQEFVKASIGISIINPETGRIFLRSDSGVLNFLDGYNYTVQKKGQNAPNSAYRTVARGFIEVFNR